MQAVRRTSLSYEKRDLVVMDIETFARRESMLRLRENLILAEEDRLVGKEGYSIDEVSTMMKVVVQELYRWTTKISAILWSFPMWLSKCYYHMQDSYHRLVKMQQWS